MNRIVGLLAGCSGQSPVGEETVQVRAVEPAGFLEDYSILSEGGDGEASLIYRNPAFAAWSSQFGANLERRL